MSEIELTNRIVTTNVTISRYISSGRCPRIDIVAEIAKVFNVSIGYLLGFSTEKVDILLKTNP